MKRLPVFILAFVVFVAVVTGCRGTHRYDSRLTAADSLMQVDPDSALALVMAVSPDSLTGEGDRAYRDLLLTQARYKCYIVATSDSDINRALAYYRIHSSEREKLTRAYIYKGAVMEELGNPDSAMFYYKNAEATADAQDYVNLGQINIRIADLYRRYNADSEVGFEKYRQALHYYQLTGNKRLQQNCFFNMANCSADSAVANYRHYYQNAYNLAVEINDSAAMYACQEFLCRHLYTVDSTHKEAKQVALDCINHYRRYVHQNTYIDLAFIYVYENRPDSARYYLDVVDVTHEAEQVKMRYYWALSLLYKNVGDTVKSNYYSGMKSLIADSIDNNRVKNHIQNIENVGNKSQASNKLHKINKLRVSLWAVSLMALILLIFLTWYVKRMRGIAKRSHEERIAIKQELNDVISALQEKQQEQASATELFKYRLDALNELFNSIKFKSEDKQQGKIRDIIPLSSVIMGLSDNYSVLKIELSDQFWEKMKRSVDGEYNGIVSFVENKYPELTLKERRLFCLLCANISPQIIRLCMNYSNVKSVTNNRSIIIKKKMGLDMTLEEFRDSYMKNQL